jgi:hypothetical protein
MFLQQTASLAGQQQPDADYQMGPVIMLLRCKWLLKSRKSKFRTDPGQLRCADIVV